MRYSEQFDNVIWPKIALTVTSNATTAPSGNLTADKLVEDATNNQHRIDQTTTSVIGTNTFSVFAKKAERDFVWLRVGTSGAYFDLTNGTILGMSGVTASIENYGNGWYKCIIVRTSTVANEIARINLAIGTNGTYAGTAGNGLFIWGAQLEQGSNATSYIPTVASAVTRNADVISKTGIADLIGQTEGTLYAEVILSNPVLGDCLIIDNGTINNFIVFRKLADFRIRVTIKKEGSGFVNIITSQFISTGFHKIALGYKNGDYALYIDGVLEGTSTNSTNYPETTLTRFNLSNKIVSDIFNDRINSALLFKTRLSNIELQQLTTL